MKGRWQVCEAGTFAFAGKQVLRWCKAFERVVIFPQRGKQKFNSVLWQES